MANVIITGTNTNTQFLNSTGDTYFLAPGALHYVVGSFFPMLQLQDNLGNLVTSMDIIVQGSMVSFDATAISHSSLEDVSNISILVGSQGSITSASSARAIGIAAQFTTVTNNGELTGGEAIRLTGDDSVFMNNGIATSSFDGSSIVYSVIMQGEDNATTNTGTISGQNGFEVTDTGVLVNTGTISGTNRAIHGNVTGAETFTVNNSGTITGGAEAYIGNSGVHVIGNSGTMSGLITLASNNDTIVNTGLIQGDVDMAGGLDRLENSGEIAGDVQMASGNDTVINAGLIMGDLDLGTGTNTYTAVAGGAVSGAIIGSTGIDTLSGSFNSDNFDGGGGNDVLDGKEGADTLNGGGDNDSIRGGAGLDLLSGGTGDDTFIYDLETDTDVIADFGDGADQIDLSAFVESVDFVRLFLDNGGKAGRELLDISENRGHADSAVVEVLATQSGADTVLTISSETSLLGSGSDALGITITLENVTASGLSMDDFLF